MPGTQAARGFDSEIGHVCARVQLMSFMGRAQLSSTLGQDLLDIMCRVKDDPSLVDTVRAHSVITSLIGSCCIQHRCHLANSLQPICTYLTERSLFSRVDMQFTVMKMAAVRASEEAMRGASLDTFTEVVLEDVGREFLLKPVSFFYKNPVSWLKSAYGDTQHAGSFDVFAEKVLLLDSQSQWHLVGFASVTCCV